MAGDDHYRPEIIEPCWQEVWKRDGVGVAPPPDPARKDVHIATAPPFTSGNVHLGHVRSYSLGDVYARYRRLRGDAVLYGVGFDAFGLPVEIAAIEKKMPPGEWVNRCMKTMRAEFERFGFSFDWTRCYVTSEPETYRWTQWVFLWLFERGLVYKATAPVDWCDTCNSVLAKMQVENGACWRCGNPTTTRVRDEWFVRITAYLEELENELLDAGRNTRWIQGQRNLLGRTPGAEVDLYAAGTERRVTAFTATPEAAADAAFVLISPGHPDLEHWFRDEEARASAQETLSDYRDRQDRNAKNVPLVPTGSHLSLPGIERKLPLVISPLVDTVYGGGAVLGIPGAARSDAVIAERLGIEPPPAGGDREVPAHEATRFRQKDISISRQRCWGSPIPVIRCETCGLAGVPQEDLPVVLPTDVVPTGEGNPLAEDEAFARCACPKCGADARRETDTIDCWFDSVWFLCAHAVPNEERKHRLFDHPELERWIPVTLEVCGVDISPNQMGFRFLTKAGRELGLLQHVPDAEPIRDTLMHEMILADSRKMSKHLGNAVAPTELLAQFGADAVRLGIVSAASPRKTINWTGLDHVERSRAFLDQLWTFVNERRELLDQADLDENEEIDTSTAERRKLDKWHSAAIRRIDGSYERHDFHLVASNATQLFDSVQRFEDEVVDENDELDEEDCRALALVVGHLIQVLCPLTPHFCEELWSRLNGRGRLALGGIWPESAAASEPRHRRRPRAGSANRSR